MYFFNSLSGQILAFKTVRAERVKIKVLQCHLITFSVDVYSPGGAYFYYLFNERGAFWVYPYPVNGGLHGVTTSKEL